MPRAAGLLSIALLVVLAGCAGIGGQPPTETTTTRATTTSMETHPTTHTATKTAVPTSSVVAFETLSATDRRFFLTLVEDGSLVAPPPFELAFSPEYGHGYEYVRYDGALYEITRDEQPGFYGRYSLHVERAMHQDGGAATAYQNLSVRAQTVFRTALADEAPKYGYAGDEFPREEFVETRAITHNGTRYFVTVEVGDYIRYRYTVEKVRGD